MFKCNTYRKALSSHNFYGESQDGSSDGNSSPSKSKRYSSAKKSKSKISVCLEFCHYPVVRKILFKLGYVETNIADSWNFCWAEFMTLQQCRNMKRYQKINHFPGILEICRKDLMAKNLNRMSKIFPNDYNFFPRTWILPTDLKQALSYSTERNKTYILKPVSGCQGRGICITQSLKQLKHNDCGVCQIYLKRPFLIDGYKFDIRLYVLITSCDPLRIYIYEEGLLRFATSKYKEPSAKNMSNIYMHLTNYAVNKNSNNYNSDQKEGSKRKLSWFKMYMKDNGYNVDHLLRRIDDMVIKTILSAYATIRTNYFACFPYHDVMPACFELLGFDILLDYRLNPQLLEVNHSPSFRTDTTIDWEIKEALLDDVFAMVNLEYCDKVAIMRDDLKLKTKSGCPKPKPAHAPFDFTEYYRREMDNRGNFRLIYPALYKDKYNKFIDYQVQPTEAQIKLYSDRSRLDTQNAIRHEMVLRAKIIAAKQAALNVDPPPKPDNQKSLEKDEEKIASKIPIVDLEEKQRLMKLAERDNLLRRHNLLEHIYFSMKKNGTLRPRELKKYAELDKFCERKKNCNKKSYPN